MNNKLQALMMALCIFPIAYGIYVYFRGGGWIPLIIFLAGAYGVYQEEINKNTKKR